MAVARRRYARLRGSVNPVGYNRPLPPSGAGGAREQAGAMTRVKFMFAAMQAVLILAGPSVPGLAGSNSSATREPYLTHSAQDTGGGTVRLELVPSLASDPAGSLRLRAVLQGPLSGEGATDLYAFNAVLRLPGELVRYVPGSARKGDLLGQDGRDWMVTAAVSPGHEDVLTVGGSRLGAVPGVAVPAGSWELFSLAFKVKGPGAAPFTWEEATFIDARIRSVDVARFVGATLHLDAGEDTPLSEDHQ